MENLASYLLWPFNVLQHRGWFGMNTSDFNSIYSNASLKSETFTSSTNTNLYVR